MASIDLTTLANAKAWLNITNATSDALLSRLVSAASQFAESYCSRLFNVASFNETRNGLGGQQMVLLNQPITAVASLSIDGVSVPARPALSATITTTGLPGGYSFDDSRLMLDGWYFCRGNQNVQVAYTAGYATAPYDLEQAVIHIVGEWFKYRDRIGKTSEGIEGQAIMFTQAQIPPRALAVLSTYKQVAPIY